MLTPRLATSFQRCRIYILLYDDGVENNGVKVGTLTFKIPRCTQIFYTTQVMLSPNRLGRFIIRDIDTNTFIDVEKEIEGKKSIQQQTVLNLQTV